jgi:hypothetical protein
MLLPAHALALYAAQNASPALVLSAGAEVRRLSSSLGERVSITGSLDKEVLFVDARGEPPQVELRAVAASLHASVVQIRSGISIVRTSADRKALDARRTEERLGWLQRCLEVQRKFRTTHLASPTDSESIVKFARSQAEERRDFLGHKTHEHGNFSLTAEQLLPSGVLLEKLVERLGLKMLAAIPTGEGRVWESNPTGASVLQLPECSDLLGEFNTHQEALSATPVPDGLKPDLQMLLIPELWKLGTPPVVRLRISCTCLPNLLSFKLEGGDALGNVRARAHFLARPTDYWFNSSEIADRLHRAGLEKPVSLSPEELKEDGISPIPPGSPLPDWEIRPDIHEPLGYLVAKAVTGTEEGIPQKCFVADMADSFFVLANDATKDGVLDVRQFQALVLQTEPYEQVDDKDALIWRPIDPEAVEGARADRKVLSDFMRSKQQGEPITTYESAKLCRASARLQSQLGVTWLRFWWEETKHEWQSREILTPPELFMLGGINEIRWGSLLGGQTLTANDLGIRDDLSRLLTSDRIYLTSGEASLPEDMRHAVDTLGDSDPGDVRLFVHPTEQQMVMDWHDDRLPHFWHPLDIQLLAYDGRIQASYDPGTDTASLTSSRQDYEASLSGWKFRFGTLASGVLTIEFPHSCYRQIPLAGTVSEPTPILEYADIDPAIKDKIWQLAQRAAIERSLKSGRAAERLRQSTTQGGGGGS